MPASAVTSAGKIPSDSAVTVNKMLSPISSHRLPTIGTSSTKTLSSRIQIILKMEKDRIDDANEKYLNKMKKNGKITPICMLDD